MVDFPRATRYHIGLEAKVAGVQRRIDNVNEKRNILYSDFNCPFCYAMHERLYEMTLLARCEWRGVQDWD